MRVCYNCGQNNHFIAECPYEKKEDHGGRLVRKDRTKFIPNKNKNFRNKNNNKKPQQKYVLIHHEEYESGEEESEEEQEENGGVAAIAVASTPSTSSTSLFDSPNENIIKPTCLMAKASLVNSSPSCSTPSNSSYDASSLKAKQEIVELSEFLKKMEGSTKVHVEAFMNQLGATHELVDEKEATISEMLGHAREAADEIASLSQALEEEQTLRENLEETLEGLEETNNIIISKLKKERDHALALVNKLKSEKVCITSYDRKQGDALET